MLSFIYNCKDKLIAFYEEYCECIFELAEDDDPGNKTIDLGSQRERTSVPSHKR